MIDPFNVKVKALHSLFELPKQATSLAAGFDLKACMDDPLVLNPGDTTLVPLGFAVELPEGFELQIRPRSGLALKHGITILNSPGTVDCDYRGEVGAIVHNSSPVPFSIEPKMKICQAVVQELPPIQFELVDELSDTTRGSGGFGSTGIQ